MTENEQTSRTENPYASPISVDASPSPLGFLEEKDIRTFVGQRVDYYVAKWRTFSTQGPNSVGFNWAAFFLGGLWLGYRKMYVATTIYYAVVVGEAIAEDVLFLVILGNDEVPAGPGRAFGFGLAIICGACGNRWYLSHAKNVISEVRARPLDEAGVAEMLSARGGTSVVASLGFAGLFLVVTFVVFTVLGFLFSA